MLAEDATARTSLAALAQLDTNGDKSIDESDARFGELRVWVDANSNGRTDTGELRTLREGGITSIGLVARNVDNSLKVGNNLMIATATFTRTNGMIATVGDVGLAYKPGIPVAVADTTSGAVPPFDIWSDLIGDTAKTGALYAVEPSAHADIANAAAQLASALSGFAPGRSTGELDRRVRVDEGRDWIAADRHYALA